MKHDYIRLKEDGTIERCPTYDYDGKITGKIVINIPAYFDEYPDERKRLGWVQHNTLTKDEIAEQVGGWDKQRQYLVKSLKTIDEWTVQDEYHVMDKSEEMMLMEEISQASGSVGFVDTGIVFFGGEEM